MSSVDTKSVDDFTGILLVILGLIVFGVVCGISVFVIDSTQVVFRETIEINGNYYKIKEWVGGYYTISFDGVYDYQLYQLRPETESYQVLQNYTYEQRESQNNTKVSID